ncbi:MAG: TonB family protein [Pyrinomonadaceae bacterium]
MKKLSFFFLASLLFLSTQMLLAQNSDPEEPISAGVVNGKAISLPAPEYPEKAKDNNIRGTVVVEVIIDKEGKVESAKAISGHPDLREVSVAAALKAKFKPTLLQETPVTVRGVIVYNFENKPEKTERAIEGRKSPGVINGLATSLPHPVYPAAAKAVCAEGTVNVKVVIDANGDVLSAEAVRGHPLLRSASVSAAMKAKFSRNPLPKTSGILVYRFISDTECSSDTN